MKEWKERKNGTSSMLPPFQSSSLPVPEANDGILRKSYEIYNVLLYGYYMDIRLSVKEIFRMSIFC